MSMKVQSIALSFLSGMLLFACSSKTDRPQSRDLTLVPSYDNAVDHSDKELDVYQYMDWIQQLRGLTFDESENSKLKVSLTGRPCR